MSSPKIAKILIAVSGTHQQTRQSKGVTQWFNSDGSAIDAQGNLQSGVPALDLSLLNVSAQPPEFPQVAWQAAMASGDGPAMEELLATHQEAFAAYQSSVGGGAIELQLAKLAHGYVKQHHGFQEEDGDHFVLKQDDMDVVIAELADGKQYTISGTAVFGR